MAKVKVTAVSYLNTIPFLYGIRHSAVNEFVDLRVATPAQCAVQLEAGDTDLALMPVAATLRIPNCEMISNYCIGAVRNVRSVALLSNKELADIHTVYLDPESRTSVLLARILLKNYWQHPANFKPFNHTAIRDGEACVLIGDKVFEHESQFRYHYDLAETWIKYTGYPFAFAAWTATRPLSNSFIEQFNKALNYGLQHIPEALKEPPQGQRDRILPCSFDTALEYLTKNISYSFDAEKKKGLEKFLSLANGFSL
jgi:chorismate dehydratase